MKLNPDSWHARAYRWFWKGTTSLPDDLCHYFWWFIFIIALYGIGVSFCLGFIFLAVAVIIREPSVFLALLVSILFMIFLFSVFPRILNAAFQKVKNSDIVKITGEMVRGWKNKYCPIIEWQGSDTDRSVESNSDSSGL